MGTGPETRELRGTFHHMLIFLTPIVVFLQNDLTAIRHLCCSIYRHRGCMVGRIFVGIASPGNVGRPSLGEVLKQAEEISTRCCSYLAAATQSALREHPTTVKDSAPSRQLLNQRCGSTSTATKDSAPSRQPPNQRCESTPPPSRTAEPGGSHSISAAHDPTADNAMAPLEGVGARLAPWVQLRYRGSRRIRLEAYGARLESGLGASPHEFESRILRQEHESPRHDVGGFVHVESAQMARPSRRIR